MKAHKVFKKFVQDIIPIAAARAKRIAAVNSRPIYIGQQT